jgi:hypothetical protein
VLLDQAGHDEDGDAGAAVLLVSGTRQGGDTGYAVESALSSFA